LKKKRKSRALAILLVKKKEKGGWVLDLCAGEKDELSIPGRGRSARAEKKNCFIDWL